ncbi:hypothetical protein INS49_015617 [Diaporthe citri]|uniref:uncharacterized protein n=1 Tax=Diaporthe citri TaxID=83186 RepID=UPI001C80F1FC|nr:uncharacterized protein INS49_015617 [Diaporthe citri]KAG6356230.1 hypothetical protein INS49_015617 [Diaporthe citri]
MPKTRLIDCVTRRLVSAGDDAIPNPRFVALSYVWGPNVGTTTLTENLPSKLPLTIRDAMTVTKDLGFQYLWVDQYCIDQSDNVDKDMQIRHMDLITIIAAAGYDCDYGLPGVSDCSRDVLDPFILDEALTFGIFPKIDPFTNHWERGSWHTRGWTFQEAHLSRRRLVFSNTATHFECMRHGECQTEMCGGVECANSDAIKEHNFVESMPERRRRKRGLGLVNIEPITGQADPPVYSVAGIPFVVHGHGEDNLTEASFAHGLAWQSSVGGVFVDANGLAWSSSVRVGFADGNFPSWSWGDVRVWSVFWKEEHDVHVDNAFSQLVANTIYHPRGVHIEFNTNGRKELIGLAEFGEACQYSTPLSRRNPTALCFRARILSSHVTSRMPNERKAKASWDFRGYRHCGGLDAEFEEVVNLVVNNTGHPSDEQSEKNGDAGRMDNSQPHCLIEIDEKFLYEKIVSGRCNFMLLRCNSIAAKVLVVERQDEPFEPQRTARRIGILHFSTQRPHGDNHLEAPAAAPEAPPAAAPPAAAAGDANGLFSFSSTMLTNATPEQVALPASGTFNFGLDSATDTICYNITLNNFQGDFASPATTATHIHEAAAGQSGPPRIAFPNPVAVGDPAAGVMNSAGCIRGPFTTGVAMEGADTGAGFTVAQIEANPAGFFADTHSSLAMPGAVRGQLA